MKKVELLIFVYIMICQTSMSLDIEEEHLINIERKEVEAIGLIKEINGKPKLDEYFSKTKRAIIEIDAPWCDHCKHFSPAFEQLYLEVMKYINIIV